MNFESYLATARKRWRALASCLLIALAATAAITVATPSKYQASTRLFVSTSGAESSSDLLQGSSFAQNRVQSYADVITSPLVLNPVIESLGLHTDASGLAQHIDAHVPTATVLLDVTVSEQSPRVAAEVADSLGKQFAKAVPELETTGGDGASPVKVSIIAKPTVPTSPVSPKPVRNLLLGGVIGILLGFGCAVFRETQDRRIKGGLDCGRVTEAAIIGGIGYDSDAPKHPLVVQTNPHSGRAEAFRSLRTNLQYIDAADHPRSIVFTSSVPDEGKTTTAANLATTIAAGGAKVCIVEADLRRPRLLRYMGLEGGVGLTTVLIGQAKLDDVLQQFAGMSVLGAGHVPPNPSELLGSQAMRETVRELERRYDVVIIDAPPLLPVTDGAVLSTVADGTVIVVGVGSTKREQLAGSVNALEHVNANILGLVLNKLPTKGPDSYSYTYYREGYAPDASRERPKSHRESKERVDSTQR